MKSYHTPVLSEQCVGYLNPHSGGVYVDATLGGGGHSLAILQKCPDIHLFGFDQDDEAIKRSQDMLKDFADRLEAIKANFSRMRTELALRKVKAIDGVIFDLGVSSHQLDTPERGFSFDNEAPLDMRMDRSQDYTAADAVNGLSQAELTRIFKEYGEDPNATRIARKIEAKRASDPIKTTGDLARIIESAVGAGTKESLKTKVRIFQSLRIFVNFELEVLEPALTDAINILKPGGRIVVLSYHSLEDRVVKHIFRSAATGCDCPTQVLDCVCGKKKKLQLLNRKPLTADPAEVEQNVRSRSVRLRAAEKIKGE
ncbi:MAG: 16S rRNA (cytosine(1402)-N(4))-methyltransferase RsmH [Candidatus Syntrophosphaera sp.]|nr:16S rRNA (cytosine(1402)-N(4))-methyltransferase RsmH [Candidatus Syntrophosphaera sp.]